MKLTFYRFFVTVFVLSILLPIANEPVLAAGAESQSVADWLEDRESPDNPTVEEEIDSFEKPIKQPEEMVPSQNVGITVGDVIRSIVALLFVLLLLFFVLKWLQKKNDRYPSTQMIKNFGGTSLGNNRSIQIIHIGTKFYIVGVGENVELLKEIDDEDEINVIMQKYEEQMDQMVEPRDILSKLISRFRHEDEKKEKKTGFFKKELEEQLEQILKRRKDAMEGLENENENHEKGSKTV